MVFRCLIAGSLEDSKVMGRCRLMEGYWMNPRVIRKKILQVIVEFCDDEELQDDWIIGSWGKPNNPTSKLSYFS